MEVIEVPATSPFVSPAPPIAPEITSAPNLAISPNPAEDPLADESRPSLNLYFPLHSSGMTTSPSSVVVPPPAGDSALDLTVLGESVGELREEGVRGLREEGESLRGDEPTIVSNQSDLDLSGLIKEQLKINQQLREMGGFVDRCPPQPAPISYTSPQPAPISYTSPPPSLQTVFNQRV